MIQARQIELSKQADPTNDRDRGKVEGLTEALAIMMLACTGAQPSASNGHTAVRSYQPAE